MGTHASTGHLLPKVIDHRYNAGSLRGSHKPRPYLRGGGTLEKRANIPAPKQQD
jgi:hypothetical protein